MRAAQEATCEQTCWVIRDCFGPAGTLVTGVPARIKRDLTQDEREHILWYANNYVNYRLNYMGREDEAAF